MYSSKQVDYKNLSKKKVDYKELDYETLNKFGLSIKNFYILNVLDRSIRP